MVSLDNIPPIEKNNVVWIQDGVFVTPEDLGDLAFGNLCSFLQSGVDPQILHDVAVERSLRIIDAGEISGKGNIAVYNMDEGVTVLPWEQLRAEVNSYTNHGKVIVDIEKQRVLETLGV